MRLKVRSFAFLSVLVAGFMAGGYAAGASSARITPVVEVIRKHADSVVNISTERTVLLRQNPFWGGYGSQLDQFFDEFFALHAVGTVKLRSVGSGVIIRQEGLIITNAHVVNMANQVYVILNDGTSVPGKVIAVAQNDDIALIQITPPRPLKPIQLADPNDILIGETVVSIGNPLGLENSVSVGVVSGKNRSFAPPGFNRAFTDLIQTDASINPGNSGGALLNLDGALVGINLAVVQNAQNIGFAISAKKVRELMAEYERMTQPKETAVQIPVKVRRS